MKNAKISQATAAAPAAQATAAAPAAESVATAAAAAVPAAEKSQEDEKPDAECMAMFGDLNLHG